MKILILYYLGTIEVILHEIRSLGSYMKFQNSICYGSRQAFLSRKTLIPVGI